MGVIHKKIRINVTNRIIGRLKDLDYDVNDKEIEIWQEDLIKMSPTSKIKVEVECDGCHKHFESIIQNITRDRDYTNDFIFCKPCADKYVRENFHDEIREKTKETFRKRYGVEHNFQLKECLEKREDTWEKNYGVRQASQAESVKAKKAQTLYKNQSVPTSDEQIHLSKLFNGDLNYPIGGYSADILINSPGMKIDFEFDGWAHKKHVVTGKSIIEQFWEDEHKRNEYMVKHGYKVLRLVTQSKKLPDDKILIKITNDCVNQLINGENVVYFDIDNFKFIGECYE